MQDVTYKASVGENHDFYISESQLNEVDLLELAQKDEFHLIHNNKSLHVKLEKSDEQKGEYTMLIDGKQLKVTLSDAKDMMVEKLGLSVVAAHKVSDVKSPMPGLVLEILVTEGQEVEEGDPLLILEAMKMENVLKATGAGTIQSIQVEAGQAVEKNQLLLKNE